MAKPYLVLRNFGDLITADHKVLGDNCESRHNHRYAVVVQDLATQWIQAYPCKTKTSQETQRSFQKFLEPDRKPKVINTDNSLEFGKACENLSWNHCTSTPHRSETNGIAERAVRRVKEGTSAVLLQSGLNESWWADSMECFSHLQNVQDLLSMGRLQTKDVLENFFKGRSFRLVRWLSIILLLHRTSQESINLERKFYLDYSSETLCTRGNLEGCCTGSRPWGVGDDGRIWNLLEKTQCKRGDISPKRRIYFSNSRWTNQNTRRRSGTENIHLDTAATKSRRGSHWLSWRIRRIFSTNFWLVSGCRWSDKWILVHVRKLHIPPSRWTQSQTHSPREESFPIPLKYIDVSRTTHTNLDVKQEKTHRRIVGISLGLETCQILGQVSHNLLSWKKNLLTDIHGPGGD